MSRLGVQTPPPLVRLIARMALSMSGGVRRPSCTRQCKQELGTTDALRCTAPFGEPVPWARLR